ncbi:MAG: hypothetical protein MHM6MM_004934 [Cercozoa sp. M6MM]
MSDRRDNERSGKKPRKFVAIPSVLSKEELRRALAREKQHVAQLTDELADLRLSSLKDLVPRGYSLMYVPHSQLMQALDRQLKEQRAATTTKNTSREPTVIAPDECASALFACDTFDDFEKTFLDLMSQKWLWKRAQDEDARNVQEALRGRTVHPDYASRYQSYRLTEVRFKLLCELVGITVHIPWDYAYYIAPTSPNHNHTKESEADGMSLEDATSKLTSLFESLDVTPPVDIDDPETMVIVMRFSPRTWLTSDHDSDSDSESGGCSSDSDLESSSEKEIGKDRPAIEELVKHLSRAFELLSPDREPPRSTEAASKVSVVLAAGVSGWWRASGWNTHITKRVAVALATMETVQHRSALYLPRLNRVVLSRAGLHVFEHIQRSETVAKLLWKHVKRACLAVLRQGHIHWQVYLLRAENSRLLADRGIRLLADRGIKKLCERGCGKSFATPGEKQDHMFSCRKRNRIRCEAGCGHVYTSRYNKYRHWFRCHKRPASFCELGCGHRYTSARDKGDHMFACSKRERRQCEAGCGHIYTSKNDRTDHQYVCSKRSKIRCDRCGVAFTSSKNKSRHKLQCL